MKCVCSAGGNDTTHLFSFLWERHTQQTCPTCQECRRSRKIPNNDKAPQTHHRKFTIFQPGIKMAKKKSGGSFRTARRRRWWHLRQRWRMLGVFEINPEHEFYHLTSVIKEAIHVSIQTGSETPIQDELRAEHFKAEETQTHQAFEMQTFAGPVFAKLRHSLDITEEEYLNSLCSSSCYLQFVSNSKSKADFFMTNDRRFFLKTQSKREVQFLLSNLRAYVDHLDKYPHSLMVRFLGVHRIVIPNDIKKYFIVMQSVFYPDERINIRYDIKGCEVGRWTNPDTDGKQIIKVLKDNNFEGQHIALGEQTGWFADQVKADVGFLQRLGVLDYSLLLAHQPLHRDEVQGKRSLADLVIRTTMSLACSPTGSDPPTLPFLEESTGQVVADTADRGSGQPQAAADETGEGIPLQEIKRDTAETQATFSQCTVARNDWKTCGKAFASEAGHSPQSAPPNTHTDSASGYRTTLKNIAHRSDTHNTDVCNQSVCLYANHIFICVIVFVTRIVTLGINY
ncbi:phosphatidylinositol 4-phosphate 5-kinase-like protein 1 isoform X2 [Genypterus blacodes]|uniref:phosphatidylinositol 4-phosphate 5-kinase-like protein 1 isoform X2 n=1 Tax=Genypterus blacodes TaxID=154954 RepID=UPI003F7632D4